MSIETNQEPTNENTDLQTEPGAGTPADESVQSQGQPTGDQSQSQGDPQPSADELVKRVEGLETATADERKKRQAAEQELEFLRRQQTAQPQPQQQPQQPQVDWHKEDDAFWSGPSQYVHRVTEARAQQIAEQRASASEQRRLAASERRVAAQHEDYREKFVAFDAMVRQEPWLWEQVTNSAEPAQEMYDLVTRRMTYGSSPDEMRTKIEAEVRARLEAESRERNAQNAAAGATPTQAGARGTGPTAAQPEPTPGHVLDDVLPDY